ncbi:hypothetical protein ERO13_D12G161800v2 [Gossypium hirsutum]|uniref:Uncharacterized protein n=2 Tax=Gossypium TaxID=3633 RepID=A0A5D2SFY1_GOSMU|nr:hypothetical protein ERO13_D12G161800v2 [Gossypium hirsutum]TYG41615.1 hypothetical protein ES288_D12G189800v1 [Gossypium darwinii]TYG90462.1 hypothetical protein ES288_A12G184100v1 [Gossypium darwinii]TYI51522.1 hypothetical protein E1A91_D12G182400v1 [Gossypium mustelinum]
MLGGIEETCRSRRFELEMMLDSFNQSFLLKEFIRPIGFDDHVNLG